MEQPFTYYAFISYSHRDEEFAKKVQDYLEHYRLPSVLCRHPKYLHPIFRDKTDLPIDELEDALREALAASRHLIVLCSEHSAQPNEDGKKWVDEEIDMFNQLRNKETQHIIPILVPRQSSSPSAPTLPEKLIPLNIAPINPTTLEEQYAFNEVIARLTGISPDALWKDFQSRMNVQRLCRAAAFTFVGILATLAGAWCWDYYAPHVRYYADYIERYNIPEGLRELSKEQAEALGSHYRFTTRMRLLRKVEHCNAAGKLVEHTDFWNRERPARLTLSYSTSPQGHREMVSCTYDNAQGQTYTTLKFSYGNIDFSHHGKRTVDSVPGQQQPSILPRQSVGRFELTREQEGANAGIIVQELHHRYRSAALVKDDWGISGRAYELDHLGRTVGVRFLSVQDILTTPIRTAPAANPQGIARYRLEYGQNGRVSGITCFDVNDIPLPHPFSQSF